MNYPNDTGTGTGSAIRCNLASVDDLLPDIKHYLPGCNAEITMRKALATVIQNFCRQTGVFQYTLDDITVVDKQYSYLMSIPLDADILTVDAVTQYGLDSDGDKEDDGNLFHPKAYDITDDILVNGVYLKLVNALGSTENSQSVLVIEVSLIPSYDQMIGKNNCSIPDKLMRRWRQAFVSGAIADLASMTNERWSNKGLAENQRVIWQEFHDEAIDKAVVAKLKKGGGSVKSRTKWV